MRPRRLSRVGESGSAPAIPARAIQLRRDTRSLIMAFLLPLLLLVL